MLPLLLVLLLILRLAGSRTLAGITTFDFVLILIISEAVQSALIDNDHSMTNVGATGPGHGSGVIRD